VRTGAFVAIDAEHGSEDELRTADLLRGLLDEFDLSRYTFTDRVRVDENAIPHSHPVLTMSTRFMVRTRDGALSDYLHEQLHWHVANHRRAARAADREWRRNLGRVPNQAGGGARTPRSTRLHHSGNWLELDALTEVVGAERARAVIQSKTQGRIYPWVYRQVLDRGAELARVLRAVGLVIGHDG
jgi:hypothetical protein